MSRKIFAIALAFLLFIGGSLTGFISGSFSINAKARTRELRVPITMYKAYEDAVSMANNSISHTATVIEEDGKSYVTVDFKGMDLMGMHGNVTNVFSYPAGASLSQVKSASGYQEAEVNSVGNDIDLDQQTRQFPRKVTFVRNAVGEKQFYIRVWVNAMDSLQGGEPGAGAQNARFVLNYSKAQVVSDSGDGAGEQPSSQQAQEPTQTQPKATDKTAGGKDANEKEEDGTKPGKSLPEKLENGKYTFSFDLWNSTEQKQSMGHKSFNKTGILEVKDKDLTVYMSVHPMNIADITASVETIEYKDASGKWAAAEVIEKRIEGGKPSAFKFPLLSKGEFLDVMVNPKVAVMGSKPIPARIKFDWGSLKKDDNAKLDDNIKTSFSTKATPAADMLDAGTGIKVVAPERTVPTGAKIKVTQIDSGSEFDAIKKTYKNNKLKVYNIQVVNQAGDVIEPLNAVDVYIPIPSKWNKSSTTLSVHNKAGARTQTSANIEGDKFKLHTNKLGVFALNDSSNITLSVPVIVGIVVAGSLVIIAVIMVLVKNKKMKVKNNVE